jgi:hypothetical protein
VKRGISGVSSWLNTNFKIACGMTNSMQTTKPGKTGNPHATENGGYRRVSEIRVISALHWCIPTAICITVQREVCNLYQA